MNVTDVERFFFLINVLIDEVRRLRWTLWVIAACHVGFIIHLMFGD